MVTCVRVALVFCLLGTVPAPASDDERITSDLSESVRAGLFVVPLRIETKQGAESGECTSLGVDQLSVQIRKRIS